MRMIDGAKLVEKLRLIATCWSISPFVSKENKTVSLYDLESIVGGV